MYDDDSVNNPAAATVVVKSRLVSEPEWSTIESTSEPLDFGDGCTVIILPRQIEDECAPLRQLRQIVKQEATLLDRSDSQRVWRVEVDSVSVLSRLTQLTFEPLSCAVNGLNNLHTWTLVAGRQHLSRNSSGPQQHRLELKVRRPEDRNGYATKSNVFPKRNPGVPITTPKRPMVSASEAAKRARTDPARALRQVITVQQPNKLVSRPATASTSKDTKRAGDGDNVSGSDPSADGEYIDAGELQSHVAVDSESTKNEKSLYADDERNSGAAQEDVAEDYAAKQAEESAPGEDGQLAGFIRWHDAKRAPDREEIAEMLRNPPCVPRNTLPYRPPPGSLWLFATGNGRQFGNLDGYRMQQVNSILCPNPQEPVVGMVTFKALVNGQRVSGFGKTVFMLPEVWQATSPKFKVEGASGALEKWQHDRLSRSVNLFIILYTGSKDIAKLCASNPSR